MRKGLLYFIACASSLVFSLAAPAQEGPVSLPGPGSMEARSSGQHNFSSFTPGQSKILLNDEVLRMNKGFEDHPELGLLTQAPCDNCYELLGRRTESAKTFAQMGSMGSGISIMSVNEPIHYKSEAGAWLNIPMGLRKEAEGIFSVFSTQVPIVVNTREGFTQIGKGSNSVTFNSNLSLIFIDANNKELNLGKIDWSSYTAGDDGLYIRDAWPGIDMTMAVYQGKIKTNFVLRNALPRYQSGKLVIRDVLKFSKELVLKEVADDPAIRFALMNPAGEREYHISPAIGFEENNVRGSTVTFPYEQKDDHTLDLVIGGYYLNLPAASYPFIIDPLFSADNQLAVNTMGTKNGGLTDPCSYINYVNVPEAITITGLKFTFGYQIGLSYYPGLNINNVGFRLRLGVPGPDTCASPTYSCVNDTAGGRIPNQCYAVDYIPVHEELKACYPPPQCASYPLPVVLDFYRAAGPAATCDNKTIAWNYLPFIVVVEGRTLELNYPMGSSLGSYETCGDSVDLSVKPEYGVPPYRYFWTPGEGRTQSVRVAPVSNTEYVVKILDQCDNEVSAKADIVVKSPSAVTLSEVLCNADLPYVWNGITISSPGTYTYTGKNVKDCDSVVTLNLSLVPVRSDTIKLPGCGSVKYKNRTYTSSVLLRDTLRAPSGCDTLHRIVAIQIKETRIWLPNVFSPNGDGNNDEFGPELIGEDVNAYSLKIFNRWGAPVFSSFNKENKWDGTFNGQPVNVGTYYYHFTAKCNDDVAIEEKGSVDLIR